jgi:hypothetical protein
MVSMKFRHRIPRRDDDVAELAALADGSLPADRRAALEEKVAGSPELTALLAEQGRAVAAVRGVAAEAPAGLRARIEAERRSRASRARPRRLVLAAGFAGAAAALALVVLLVLPENVPGGPTVAEAATLASLPSTDPAPAPQAGQAKLLARSVEGVFYPNWDDKFGWRAAGERVDTLEGRRATTVFYEKNGKRIGYTIVEGKALSEPREAARAVREGTELRTFTLGDGLAVTWLRQGKTCILSGEGVARDVLLKLAAWKGKGAVRF